MVSQDFSKPAQAFAPGKIIVQFKPESYSEKKAEVHTLIGAPEVEEIPELNIDIINVEPGSEMDYINKYLSSGDVISAELDYYMYPAYKPNDPYYTMKTNTSAGLQRQWGLRRIRPQQAWNEVHDLTPSVKIAIIDSGIDPNHPDLKDKITDPINFFAGVPSTDYIDRAGHGTFVAGIAAAITDNNTGIAGASFNTAYIMPIRAGDTFFLYSTVIQGINYAVQKGAKIIQMSLGGPEYSNALQVAIDYAWNNNVLIVVSAGNDGNEQINYPGGCNHTLTVSATDKANLLAEFSCWGIDVGITAPGVDILSTTPTYPCTIFKLLNYDTGNGTSFSSPFVSGVAAMMLAVNPALTNQQLVDILEKTASPIEEENDERHEGELEDDLEDKVWNPFFGYGLLNAGRAVKLAKSFVIGQEGLGSFYGQVISQQTGLPLGDIPVIAAQNGNSLRRYITKTNSLTTTPGLNTDGMFRLFNLTGGTYDIYVRLPGQPSKVVQTVTLIPGCDTFLRLVV